MFGIRSVLGQAGNGVDGLRRGLMPDGPPPSDATHLLDAGPRQVRSELLGTPQLPMFDPTVPFAVLNGVVGVRLPPPLLPRGKRAG